MENPTQNPQDLQAAQAEPALKHTPTPWYAHPSRSEKLIHPLWDITEGPSRHSPSIGILCHRPNTAEDAALIVRAVNSHEVLVGACEQALLNLEAMAKALPLQNSDESRAWLAEVGLNLRAALKVAATADKPQLALEGVTHG